MKVLGVGSLLSHKMLVVVVAWSFKSPWYQEAAEEGKAVAADGRRVVLSAQVSFVTWGRTCWAVVQLLFSRLSSSLPGAWPF